MKVNNFTDKKNEVGRSIRLFKKAGHWNWEYRSNGHVTARCKPGGYASKLGCMNSAAAVSNGMRKVLTS